MDPKTEMVDIPVGTGAMPAFLARPGGDARTPVVLVIQEAFGLNAHIKDVARRVAGEGYAALAPDLFYRGGKGRIAGYDELPKALQYMGELTDDGITADVGGAIAWLEKQPFARPDRVGITGFCMGGRVSFLAACTLPDKVTASAPFYGGGIPIYLTEKLKVPVLAFFGDQDPFIPLDHVEALKAEAKKLGKRVDVVVYPGAPHGFFCNERDSYRPEAAADSWERVKKFFAQHLKG
jgi:carboxymethylenebutenolidase